jgi:hypothetical protein
MAGIASFETIYLEPSAQDNLILVLHLFSPSSTKLSNVDASPTDLDSNNSMPALQASTAS